MDNGTSAILPRECIEEIAPWLGFSTPAEVGLTCIGRLALCSKFLLVRAWTVQRQLVISDHRAIRSISASIASAKNARLSSIEALEFRYTDSIASASNLAALSLIKASRGSVKSITASAVTSLQGLASLSQILHQDALGANLTSISLSVAINWFHLYGQPTLDQLQMILQPCPNLITLRLTAMHRCAIDPALGPIATYLKLWCPKLESLWISGEYIGRDEIGSIDSLAGVNELCLQVVRDRLGDDPILGQTLAGLLLPNADLHVVVQNIRRVTPPSIGMNVFFSHVALNPSRSVCEPEIIGNLLCLLISRRAPTRTIAYLIALREIDLDAVFEASVRHSCSTPLIAALKHPKYVRILLKAGCNPCHWISYGEGGRQTNAFLCALQRGAALGSLQLLLSRKNMEKCKDFIIKNGLAANRNEAEAYLNENVLRDPRNGDTLLHLAARTGNLKVFKLVCAARPKDLDKTNWLGETARDLAMKCSSIGSQRVKIVD